MERNSLRKSALRKTFSRLGQNCARLTIPPIAAFEIRSASPPLEKFLEHLPPFEALWRRYPGVTSQLETRMSKRNASNLLREHWTVFLDLALTPKTPLGLAWFGIKNSLSSQSVDKLCLAFAEIQRSLQIKLESKGIPEWMMKSGKLVLTLIL